MRNVSKARNRYNDPVSILLNNKTTLLSDKKLAALDFSLT